MDGHCVFLVTEKLILMEVKNKCMKDNYPETYNNEGDNVGYAGPLTSYRNDEYIEKMYQKYLKADEEGKAMILEQLTIEGFIDEIQLFSSLSQS